MQHELRKAVVLEHMTLAVTEYARRVARQVEAGWIGQEHSPLGRRAHCAAVKRRIAQRAPSAPCDAAIIGRRHLLTVDALVEEYFASREAPVANENGRAS